MHSCMCLRLPHFVLEYPGHDEKIPGEKLSAFTAVKRSGVQRVAVIGRGDTDA